VTANLLLLLELMEKVRTSMPIPMPSNWMKRMTVSISYPGRVISYWYSTWKETLNLPSLCVCVSLKDNSKSTQRSRK
jgi:hypothetical protein